MWCTGCCLCNDSASRGLLGGSLDQSGLAAGCPAGQARLEALTLWMGIVRWEPVLRQAQGKLLIIGDALGVLHDAVRHRTRDPILNSIMSEIALVIAPSGGDIRAAHLWTERNSVCDELSRLQPGTTPTAGALHNAKRLSKPRLTPKCSTVHDWDWRELEQVCARNIA